MGDSRFEKYGLSISQILKMLNDGDIDHFEEIGRLSCKMTQEYQNALQWFSDVNGKEFLNGKDKTEDNAIKGKALEDLVEVLFKATGNYFEVYRNIRNGTNEIDLFLRLSKKGRAMQNLINKRYHELLCECKNYSSTVTVTYVGKFCHLMQSTNINTGIMFSYNGLAGKGWSSATGLSKKIFLLKERPDEKLCVIDFKKEDFDKILNGHSIFSILDDKYVQLKMGIDDIYNYINREHPSEKYIEEMKASE